MKIMAKKCPNCNSKNTKTLGIKTDWRNRYNFDKNIIRCSNCGNYFT